MDQGTDPKTLILYLFEKNLTSKVNGIKVPYKIPDVIQIVYVSGELIHTHSKDKIPRHF